jgi:glycosyltransferase involved in cell wall biosynthesis
MSNLYSPLRPSVAVVYGQPDHRSTSFQTTQLAKALSLWFTPVPQRVKSFHRLIFGQNQTLTTLERIVSNYLLPVFYRPRTDYVLYCNDGSVDLRMWSGKKLIYWYDAYEDWAVQPPQRRQWIHWLRYQNLLCADYVFCVSHRQVEMARQLRPGRESTVVYLPVGVNCQIFDPAIAQPSLVRQRFNLPDKTIIGYLGYIGIRGDSFAGKPIVDMAAEVLRNQDVHFLIVGFGEGLTVFQSQIEQLGLFDRFTFTGYVEDELIPHCIAAMDICIDTLEPGLHSEARSETKLKQYMAMGKACVATAIGENCIDLDHGAAGVLVSDNGNALCQGVLELCVAPERRKKLGEVARQRAESIYDWNKLAEKIVSTLESSSQLRQQPVAQNR